MKTGPIPKDGLRLSDLPPDVAATAVARQAICVDLPMELVKSMAKASANGKKEVQLAMGKQPVFHIKKAPAIPIEFIKMNRAALYKAEQGREALLKVMGSVEYKLRLEKQKWEGVGDDEALLALKNGLALAAQAKQSKTSVFIGAKSQAQDGRQAALKSKALSMLKPDGRAGMAGLTRSMPASPAIGALSPQIAAANGLKSLKAEAFKKAAIHLLAVRPVSEKYITSMLKCTAAEVEPLLNKYGRPNRLDSTKFDLSDKGFKELDVWAFKYSSEDDRQSAIDRAVSAFDRQRISREEQVWQMLLSKNQRGRGIILSKLHLHNGPIDRINTPRIHVQPTADSTNGGYTTGNDSDRVRGHLAPSDAENMARSRSQDPIKKSKVSQKEAQSKRLLSNKPTKASATSNVKVKVPKSAAKAVSKAAAKKDVTAGGKVKSAEFIENSDDDIEMVDAPVARPAPKPKAAPKATPKAASKAVPKAVPKAKASKGINAEELKVAKEMKAAKAAKTAARLAKTPTSTTTISRPLPMPVKNADTKPTAKDPKGIVKNPKLSGKVSKVSNADPVKKSLPAQAPITKERKEHDTKPLPSPKPLQVEKQSDVKSTKASKTSPSGSSSSGSNGRASDSSSVPMRRTVSHKRTTSSPIKPSPLGSSPPTNASDLENEKNAGKASETTSSAKTARKNIGSSRKTVPRSADHSTDGDSDKSLKRKANDIDSDIHQHEISIPGGHRSKRQDTTSPSASDLSIEEPQLTELDLLSRAFYDETLLYYKAHEELSNKMEMDDDGSDDSEDVKKLRDFAQRLRNMQLKIHELAQKQKPGNGWTPPALTSGDIVDTDVSKISVNSLMEGVDMARTLGDGRA